jgi:hypothetical protein
VGRKPDDLWLVEHASDVPICTQLMVSGLGFSSEGSGASLSGTSEMDMDLEQPLFREFGEHVSVGGAAGPSVALDFQGSQNFPGPQDYNVSEVT